jgi:hypothetical protein
MHLIMFMLVRVLYELQSAELHPSLLLNLSDLIGYLGTYRTLADCQIQDADLTCTSNIRRARSGPVPDSARLIA